MLNTNTNQPAAAFLFNAAGAAELLRNIPAEGSAEFAAWAADQCAHLDVVFSFVPDSALETHCGARSPEGKKGMRALLAAVTRASIFHAHEFARICAAHPAEPMKALELQMELAGVDTGSAAFRELAEFALANAPGDEVWARRAAN